MTYTAISQAARDNDLRDRIAACIASEGVGGEHPLTQADRIQWQCAGQWGDAYSYAVETNVPNPGRDLGVITDAALKTTVLDVLGISE